MARQIEAGRSGKPSLVRRGVAGLILVAIGALAIDVLFHVIVTILVVVAIVAVIAAALWAAKTLL